MMKHQMKSMVSYDKFAPDLQKQSSSLEAKKLGDDAILKEFDIDIDEFDSKIIDNPYDYIDPNYFLGNNVG